MRELTSPDYRSGQDAKAQPYPSPPILGARATAVGLFSGRPNENQLRYHA